MVQVDTIEDLINIWGSSAKLGDAIGESAWTVDKWRQRESIPQKYWTALIDAAKGKGTRLTAEVLLDMHAPPKPARRKVSNANHFRS